MSTDAEGGSKLGVDTQAILLLTAALGKGPSPVSPLTAAEYSSFAATLHEVGKRPGDLLKPGSADLLAGILPRLDQKETAKIDAQRVNHLLERGGRLALAMSRWSSAGVWVAGRADAAYPSRYKQKLGRSAPAIVYGVGPRAAIEAGGLAIVGSREPDAQSEASAVTAGAWAAGAGVQVVSGAARGVDEMAMLACTERTGSALGVVADSLLKLATRRNFREQIIAERMTLISSFDPEAGFRVWMAMLRNRWIYALADRALVISASHGTGGTWEGAVGALKAGVRVYVTIGDPVIPGNQALVAKGAIPAPSDLNDLWRDESPSAGDVSATRISVEEPRGKADTYAAALPVMLDALKLPMTAKRFAEVTGLTEAQAEAWLSRLVTEGHVQRANAVYQALEERTPQLSLLP